MALIGRITQTHNENKQTKKRASKETKPIVGLPSFQGQKHSSTERHHQNLLEVCRALEE